MNWWGETIPVGPCNLGMKRLGHFQPRQKTNPEISFPPKGTFCHEALFWGAGDWALDPAKTKKLAMGRGCAGPQQWGPSRKPRQNGMSRSISFFKEITAYRPLIHTVLSCPHRPKGAWLVEHNFTPAHKVV